MVMTHTYTYALMEVSQATFNEVKEKLLDAGYEDALMREEPNLHLNMHGLALALEAPKKKPTIAELEAILAKGSQVEIKPNGEVITEPAGLSHFGNVINLNEPKKSSALVLCGENGKLLVDVCMDGSVVFGPDFSPEPAARLLFQCFAQYLRPQALDRTPPGVTCHYGGGPHDDSCQSVPQRCRSCGNPQGEVCQNCRPQPLVTPPTSTGVLVQKCNCRTGCKSPTCTNC